MTTTNRKWHMFRMWDWWMYVAVALGYVWWSSPHQLNVIGYKVALVTVGLVMAYGADKAIYARLADHLNRSTKRDIFGAARVVARALIVLAVLMGMTRGG
jgi:uncharacterized membrane protein YiaA